MAGNDVKVATFLRLLWRGLSIWNCVNYPFSQDIQALEVNSANQSFVSYQILKENDIPPPSPCVLLGPDFFTLQKDFQKKTNKKVRRAVGVTIIPTCVCVCV
jgi:hypothetical protein